MLFVVLAFLTLSINAQNNISTNSVDKYYGKAVKLQKSLDCNATIITGQEYSGIVAMPFVGYAFTNVLTETSNFTPPSLGAGYMVSFGHGTGLSTGELEWNNDFGLGACITTGWKPTSLKSIPANVGLYALWKGWGVGYYYDTMNKVTGVSFGGSIPLTKVGASILTLRCLK